MSTSTCSKQCLPDSFKKEKTRSKTISKAEVRKLVESIDDNDEMALRDKAMIELLYDAELKVTQIINIKVEDINLDYNLEGNDFSYSLEVKDI